MIDIGQKVYVGSVLNEERKKCILCDGTGDVPTLNQINLYNRTHNTQLILDYSNPVCPLCKGTGQVRSKEEERIINQATVLTLSVKNGRHYYKVQFEDGSEIINTYEEDVVFGTLKEAYKWMEK